ncbi:unnamed protein product [Trifolium pratense]|uniref:Uncharacterized protein n=1 Tax=Trifolium pratense TaxID=57577 RepID=A0ACB0M9K1_TRIPR|nr:unnamed protein product [Trifolium pratense]
MINSSATDLRNKDKADEDAFAKLPNANMQHQHQQTGPNPLKNPKVSPFLSHFSEDDLKDEKYTLTDKMTYVMFNLFGIEYTLVVMRKKISLPVPDISLQDTLMSLDTTIQIVRTSFVKISSSSIDCVENDDFVTKEEDDDSVFELKDKLKDVAFISREVMLIDIVSGDLFKIYHKLLIIRKDILTKPAQDTLKELVTICRMISDLKWKMYVSLLLYLLHPFIVFVIVWPYSLNSRIPIIILEEVSSLSIFTVHVQIVSCIGVGSLFVDIFIFVPMRYIFYIIFAEYLHMIFSTRNLWLAKNICCDICTYFNFYFMLSFILRPLCSASYSDANQEDVTQQDLAPKGKGPASDIGPSNKPKRIIKKPKRYDD